MISRRSVPRKKGQNRRRFARTEQLETRILLAADFGDAPDGIVVDGVLRNYPTLLANNGAQQNVGSPFLGSSAPDMEANGQPNATATGDDGTGDDEDGVTFGGDVSGPNTVRAGESFTASAVLTGSGLVNVWVDWNVDGDWDDSGEHIVENEAFIGLSNFSVQITGVAPATAVPGTTFYRVRVSDQSLSEPGGAGGNGEVEDYLATIAPPQSCSLTVTTTDDVVNPSDGVTSLREAISCANETAGHDTIIVPSGVYDLDLDGAGDDTNAIGDLDIRDDLTIISATGDADDVTISAGEEFRDRIFNVHSVVANFTGVSIVAGTVLEVGTGGGGVLNESGTVTLTDSVVFDCFAPVGGGIMTINTEVAPATLILINTQVTGNVAVGDETIFPQGGGIYAVDDAVHITQGSSVTENFADATFGSGSSGEAQGGGIWIAGGSLTISDSLFADNEAIGAGEIDSQFGGAAEGGGIMISGFDTPASITNSTIARNTARGAIQNSDFVGRGGNANGGGIFNRGNLSIESTSIVDNQAFGGSAFPGGSLDSGLNGGWGWGGGIYNASIVDVSRSTLAGNVAQGGSGVSDAELGDGSGGSGWGGAIYTGGRPLQVSVTDSTVRNNSAIGGPGGGETGSGGVAFGGGIYSDAQATTIYGSTFNGNFAFGGGGSTVASGEGAGIWLRSFGVGSRADVVNSTVSGNRATGLGAGIYVGASANYNVQIVNSTIVLNEVVAAAGDLGAGIYHDDTAVLALTNTIVALNVQDVTQVASSSDLSGTFGGANNLIGEGDGQTGLVNNVNGNQVGTSESPIDPLIDALADNGGPTLTHALQSNSTAIEGGNNALAVSPIGETLEFDQRGEGFPRFVGGRVDIGAFEAAEEVCSLVVTHVGDTGIGSLREAIDCANTTPGPNTVTFAIPGAGPHTIQPLSQLPALLDITGGTTIDGYSQSGATENTNAFVFGNLANQGLNTVLQIAVDGSLAGDGVRGFILQANGNTIQGLAINGFDANEIEVTSDNNVVRGSFVGTNVTGTSGLSDFGIGILINDGSNNRIGGTSPGDRNLLSGNFSDASILIEGETSIGNTIQGNLIGTDITGAEILANDVGIYLREGATATLIGGSTAGAGNVISGNDFDGVVFDGGGGNTIAGNYIGTDVTGTEALGNGDDGLDINSSANNIIGGATAASRNLISGNDEDGVNISFSESTGNTIRYNYIGTDVTGTAALGNGDDGVDLDSASDNFVLNNLISGNEDDGVEIDGGDDAEDGDATGNVVQGNLIGTNFNGTGVIGNLTDGVSIQGASNNLIGGSEGGQGNLISGNGFDGVYIVDFGADNNSVIGNRIGTDITGMVALGNEDDGVDIDSGPRNNVINGNVISGNGDDGVSIEEADRNTVQGNFIGTANDGLTAVSNGGAGVRISGGFVNFIGGSGTGNGNLISANEGPGVSIVDSAEGNVVLGNRIGVDLDGLSLGNSAAGVEIVDAAYNLIGGINPGEGNLISGNEGEGVLVVGDSVENTILSNSIFANGELGIDLEGNGPTSNDTLDFDDGPNNLQNFPVLTSVSGGAETIVNGTLNSLPNNDYRIEFFANDALDPSGFGEGQTFLGFINVLTDASGDADFVFNAGQLIPANRPITVTATRFRFDFGEAEGSEGESVPMIFLDTSEFSAPAPQQEVADLSLTKTVDVPAPEIGETVTFTLTLHNAGPNAATGVEVTDVLPAGLMYLSSDASQGDYDEGTGIWTVGTVGVNVSLTLQIMVIVLSTDQITNRAEVTASDQFDPDSTPDNGLEGAGEDDFSTAGVGQCLYGLDGPLVVGLNRLVYTCPTPGSISAFVMGTEFGSFTFTQYNQTVDIDDPVVKALGVANENGVAVVHVQIPATMANSQVIFQAFEMSPNPQLSNTLAMSIANIPLLASAGEGSGAAPIVRRDIEAVFAEAVARWQATDLSAAEAARLESAQFRVLDLPDGLLGSALNTTIYLDRTAAGHGWFVDATPADDSEFELAVSAQERITTTSPAGDRIDLLSVIMHELGHVLGHSDENPSNAAPGLMHHELATGTRRLATDLPEADISRPLHNFDFAEDVNSDGQVTLGDALELVAHLRRHGSEHAGNIIRRVGLGGVRRLDVSGDNFVSLHDALMIVARMRNTPPGESEAAVVPSSAESRSSLLAEGELDHPLNESANGDYEAAVDAVLASYGNEDDE